MAEKSLISWTDATWNPILGCDKVSAGCAGCYAVGLAHRMAANPNPKIAAANAGLTQIRSNGQRDWTGRVNLLPGRLRLPLTWKTPRRIFVNSLSDLFHDEVPQEFVYQVSLTMLRAGWHTYQVLTKRPQRMADVWLSPLHCDWLRDALANRGLTDENIRHALRHVWMGVSVENQKAADGRIPFLLQTPAAVRWLSCEPLLGPVDLTKFGIVYSSVGGPNQAAVRDEKQGAMLLTDGNFPKGYSVCLLDVQWKEIGGKFGGEFGEFDGINWIVCGGESGENARPLHPDWARSLRDQCEKADVPFHFKQWGEYLPFEPSGQEPYWIDQTGEEHDAHGLNFIDPDTNDAGPGWFDDLFYGAAEDCAGEPCAFRRIGKKAAGRLLDGKEHDDFPEAA